MSTTLQKIRESVLRWLKEESALGEKAAVDDPNALLDFEITYEDLKLNVIQASRNSDNFFIVAKWILSRPQLDLHKSKMDDAKRVEFFWELQSVLLANNELGNCEMKPDPPNDFRELIISSCPIYYDALTKDVLMRRILIVRKSMMRSVFLLEKYAGVLPSNQPSKTHVRYQ